MNKIKKHIKLLNQYKNIAIIVKNLYNTYHVYIIFENRYLRHWCIYYLFKFILFSALLYSAWLENKYPNILRYISRSLKYMWIFNPVPEHLRE